MDVIVYQCSLRWSPSQGVVEILSQASLVEKIARSKCFEWFSCCIIVLNSIFIGWHTQVLATGAIQRANANLQPEMEVDGGIVLIQGLFTSLFISELCIRWAAEGLKDFWMSNDVGWNLLDLLCCVIGLLDVSVELVIRNTGRLDEGNPLRGVTVVRVLRIVRIVRVVRVIRIMKFFKELRMMIFSTLNSLQSVVWIFFFLFVLFYMFGIAFTSSVVNFLDTLERRQDPAYSSLLKYFGSLDVSILTLYMSMTGGQNWGVFYEALKTVPGGEVSCILFILYVTFALFAVVNIVTGVFVDTALQSSKDDREVAVQDEVEHKKSYLNHLRELFEAIDVSAEGMISRDTLQHAFKHETIVAYFNSLKIDAPDAKTLFDLLDYDQSGEIDLEEFLHGCYSLHGDASHLEAKILQMEVRFVKEMLMQLMDDFQDLRKRRLRRPSTDRVDKGDRSHTSKGLH
ncbi:unnamed protein product [Cladocopium goreaui]|uniref:Gastricsin n=1 Tax=Cladocopium goreaui TaxID=2562237 RepID=A0A9P1FRI4_9DINO|nr:unnamed protein product [Cladocopium goreaui]